VDKKDLLGSVMGGEMSRRRLNLGLLSLTLSAAAAALAGRPAPARASGELHVLNWQGYGTDEAWALQIFEGRNAVKVVHDYFNSEQEMLTKLRTNPGVYDVVLINSSYTQQAAKEGLIQPIDTSQITNFKDLAPKLRDSDYLNTGGKTFGISWVWGVTSIAYSTEAIKTKPDSIEELWNPAHAGRVGWRDDPEEAVQFAAIALGQDPNNPSNLDAIKQKLLALKPQLKTLWSSEDEWNKHMSSKDFDIATYWSGSVTRSQKTYKLPVDFVIPKEGAIGWFDGLSIAANAPNAAMAAKFIDFMVSPEFYVKWDTDVGAPASANLVAMSQLPANAFNRTVLGAPDVQARLFFMAPVPDDRRNAYNELWEQVKTELGK
jgi:spermidine/putrescine transport system substrate-binding protein